jgi:hypothetical protein
MQTATPPAQRPAFHEEEPPAVQLQFRAVPEYSYSHRLHWDGAEVTAGILTVRLDRAPDQFWLTAWYPYAELSAGTGWWLVTQMPANGELQVGGVTRANAETIRELLAGWVEQANRDATKARRELERQRAEAQDAAEKMAIDDEALTELFRRSRPS